MSGAIEKKVFVLVVLALSGFGQAQDEELASETGSEVGKIADNFRDAVTRIAKGEHTVFPVNFLSIKSCMMMMIQLHIKITHLERPPIASIRQEKTLRGRPLRR